MSQSASVAIHARDVWAWGNFMLAVLEEAGLEGYQTTVLYTAAGICFIDSKYSSPSVDPTILH